MAKLTKAVVTGNTAVALANVTAAQRSLQIFDRPGTYSWTVPSGITSLEVLVVAGGGGGGQTIGGGGGAGGLIYNSSYAVAAGQTLSITVGAGGAGAPANASSGSFPGYGTGGGTQGGNSVLSGGTGGTLTAIGGGGGGNYNQTSDGATTGGSGGGKGATRSGATSGTSGQGNAGGSGASSNCGGGGGGAGGVGGNAVNAVSGGAGGVGLAYSITGVSTFYAGGGGGGTRSPTVSGSPANGGGVGGAGGAGGGGRGGQRTGENGVDGLGGGGGGGGYDDQSNPGGPSYGGGRGGHGTVIIRYDGTASTNLATGMAQYNTDSDTLEFFDGNTWNRLDARKNRPTRQNIQLYYDFGDQRCYPGSGTTVFDLSGNQWNGTLVNSPSYQGNSFRFSSASSTRISTAFKPSGERSYFIWLKYNSLTGTNGYSLTGTQEGNAYTYIGIQDSANGVAGQGYWYSGSSNGGLYDYYYKTNKWYYIGWTLDSSGTTVIYTNGLGIQRVTGGLGGTATNEFSVGCINTNHFMNADIAVVQVWGRALTDTEVRQNFNADCERFGIEKLDAVSSLPDGTFRRPFGSPQQAQDLRFPRGLYWFQSGSMAAPRELEFEPYYYEGRPWCTVFRSPYRKAFYVNEIDLNIPMAGLLVQKDSSVNVRGAVYWSTPITYNTIGSSGDNTADSGYTTGNGTRRVILGGGGGHGIFRNDQSQCNWGNSAGALGAGYDGSTCGSFPNDLIWGQGDPGGSATYINRDGVWSHRIFWRGNNFF